MNSPPKKAGGTVNAAHKSNSKATVASYRREINGAFGSPELRTWRYEPGVCRFQTSSPEFARKLSQRSGARLVAWSVNRYLRIFQENIEPWRARILVERYLKATNGAFSVCASRPAASKSGGDQ